MPYPYFLQHPDWLNFWTQVRAKPYSFFWHVLSFQANGQTYLLQSAVYQYLWFLNKPFWYITKGPILLRFPSELENSDLNSDLILQTTTFRQSLHSAWETWLMQILSEAKRRNILFVKIDFDDLFSKQIGWQKEQDMLADLTNCLKKEEFKRKQLAKTQLVFPSSEINYTHCTFIPLTRYLQKKPKNIVHTVEAQLEGKLLTPTENSTINKTSLEYYRDDYRYYYQNFYSAQKDTTPKEKIFEDLHYLQSHNISDLEQNFNWLAWYQSSLMQDLYLCFNQRVRRYTRKALDTYQKEGWKISLSKNDSNFSKFWQVHLETTHRQKFETQPQSTLAAMCQADFGRLIVIENSQGNGLSVFLGVKFEQTLTYLFGGNSLEGMHKHSQYLLQMVALTISLRENCLYYDLGGYKPGSGYSQFKDGYRGLTRDFFGPVDVVLSLQYQIIQVLRSLKELTNLK